MEGDGFFEKGEGRRVGGVFGGVFLDREGGVLEGFLGVDLVCGGGG